MPRPNIEWLLKTPIAHRGLHDANERTAENSLSAFRLAAEGGFPIELDVHLLADGAVAVFHDTDLLRMCGINIPINALSRESLSRYSLVPAGEKIPLLEDVLNIVDGRVPLLIETKESGAPGLLESAVDDVLQGYAGAYAVQSFNPARLAWFAKHAPAIARGQLAGNYSSSESTSTFRRNRSSMPHFIGYRSVDFPNQGLVRERRLGRPVLAWTVRSQQEYDRLKAWCDNIIFEGFIPKAP